MIASLLTLALAVAVPAMQTPPSLTGTWVGTLVNLPLKPGMPRIGGNACHMHIKCGSASNHLRAFRGNIGKAAPQLNHNACNAAIAHNQVRANAQHRDGDFRGELFKKIG